MKINKILITWFLILNLSSCSEKPEEKINKTSKINIENAELFFSISDIEKHNSKEDCYTVLDWKVYNVSSFFWKHPWWDDNLMKTCWIDATKIFQWKHWNNAKAQIKKDEFYIWEIK